MRIDLKCLCMLGGMALPVLTFADAGPDARATGQLLSSERDNAGSVVVLAASNTGGAGGTYASCMNGCWRSHNYCKKHQSREIDCDHQLGQCIEWCESQYDPQRGGAGGLALPAPRQKMVR